MMALDTSNIKADARVYVVSAPSGTGKTTLNRRLVQEHEAVQMSVSYTARAKRKGEIEGVHYHYVTVDEFKAHIDHGDMLEYAEVFGNYYGTSLKEIHRIQALGKLPLLEIDVQGWSWAKKRLTNAISLFILPPSIEALWNRLEKRNTEPLAVRWRRLKTARSEIELGHLYDYFIINAAVDDAYAELQDIVIAGNPGKIGNAQGRQLCAALLKEFDEAAWLKKLSQQFADNI
jgi:guanylate kinase